MTESVENTLQERGGEYGVYSEQAIVCQRIKDAMRLGRNWYGLAADQRDALEMVAVKISRILNGNPDNIDSWHDIQGYTKLVEERLKGKLL